MVDEDIDIIGTGAGARVPKPPTPPPPPQPPTEESDSGGFMGGLRVSLMPSAEGDEAASELRKKLVILFAVLILETIIIGGAFLFVTNKEAEAMAARQKMEDTLNSVTAEIKESESKTTEMTLFDARVRGATDILENHLYWTPLFEHIKNVTKPSVQYLNFTGNALTGVVTLDAMAPSYRDAAEQIVALMENPMISEVISSSATASINDLGEMLGVSFGIILKVDTSLWKGGGDVELSDEALYEVVGEVDSVIDGTMPSVTDGDVGVTEANIEE